MGLCKSKVENISADEAQKLSKIVKERKIQNAFQVICDNIRMDANEGKKSTIHFIQNNVVSINVIRKHFEPLGYQIILLSEDEIKNEMISRGYKRKDSVDYSMCFKISWECFDAQQHCQYSKITPVINI